MKSGKCPKCDHNQIHIKQTSNIHFTFPISMFKSVHPIVYVCTKCGYTELYTDSKDLGKIREKWKQINPLRKRKNDDK